MFVRSYPSSRSGAEFIHPKTGFSGTAQPIPATTKKIKLIHFGAVVSIDPIVAAPQTQMPRKTIKMMLATNLRCAWGINCNFLHPATVWPLVVLISRVK
jgi:hypothetical protein